MAEEAPKDQQEKRDQGEEKTSLEPRPAQGWDALLVRAEVPVAPAPPPPPPGPTRSSEALRWLRAVSPLLVLAIYFGWKAFSGDGRDSFVPGVANDAPTLTGEAPAPDDSVELSGETKAFVQRLEALRAGGEWRSIAAAVAAAKPPVADHPVVIAFGLIARTRTGARDVKIIQDLQKVENRLAASSSRKVLADLIHELRVARAAQLLLLCESVEGFRRNTDEMTALLASETPTRFDVQVRIRMAELGIQAGDELMEEANRKLIGSDLGNVAEARALYQQAMRFVVTEKGWARLEPISPQAGVTVGALREKLRAANALVHGFSNPLGNYDSSTWSGRKGDAIHDDIRESGQ